MPESVACISLGSNIEPEKHLCEAVRLLRQNSIVLAVSSAYRTAPQGDTHQADFLNMAVQLQTDLTPAAFKSEIIADIERALGRVRDPNNKNAPRTIDLDISLWNDEVLDYGTKPWHIPEPDILCFAHVAVPLAEIAPDYIHPEVHESLFNIAKRLQPESVQRLSVRIC
jgi:2-amino-4-hydroxy-6-hydroxymethyldihydropteridine diphosphokinase